MQSPELYVLACTTKSSRYKWVDACGGETTNPLEIGPEKSELKMKDVFDTMEGARLLTYYAAKHNRVSISAGITIPTSRAA